MSILLLAKLSEHFDGEDERSSACNSEMAQDVMEPNFIILWVDRSSDNISEVSRTNQ